MLALKMEYAIYMEREDHFKRICMRCNLKGELKMPKCSGCLCQLKSRDVIKSTWIGLYSPIVCEKCNTKHYINLSTRLVIGFSIGVPPFFLNMLFHNGYFSFLGYFLWLAFVIYLTPFFARYHVKPTDHQS